MKKNVFILLALFQSLSSYSQDFYRITGKVTNSNNHTALPFALVYLSGYKFCGTACNESGEFILKIPLNIKNDTLNISFMGFKTKKIALKNISSDIDLKETTLEESNILLKEVLITPLDPKELLKQAIRKIPENYDTKPIMFEAFYREIKQIIPLDFTSESIKPQTCCKEAVLDIYRSPYSLKLNKKANKDYLKLKAWRRECDVMINTPEHETIENLSGSQPNDLTNDLLKQINVNYGSETSFILKDISTFDNHRVYVIECETNNTGNEFLKYSKTTIYLDVESLAFVEIDNKAIFNGQIKSFKIPLMFSAGVRILEFSSQYIYKKYNDKWNLYFSHKNYENDIIIYKKDILKKAYKKEFEGKDQITYKIKTDQKLVITGIDKTNIVKFNKDELFRNSTELKTEIGRESNDIWGKYNFIKL